MKKLALAQINPILGGFEANKYKILDYINKAKKQNADIVIFPECAICGYPPEDLLFKKSFIDKNIQIVKEIAKSVKDITVILGFVDTNANTQKIYNALAVLVDGEIKYKYYKKNLPNYGVFDEKRYFTEGTQPLILDIKNTKVAMTICEDIWVETENLGANIDITINISASPYDYKKENLRKQIAKNYVKNSMLVYCNLVGGQDELVFDGNSFVMDKQGNVLAKAKSFEEDLLVYECNQSADFCECKNPLNILSCECKNPLDDGSVEPLHCNGSTKDTNKIYKALVLGTHDYILKNGFKKVLIGLSGGIDSALVANIAVDALGKDKVICVSMPSKFSSDETQNDAKILAQNLDVEFHEIPIKKLHDEYLTLFTDIFKNLAVDTTEENIQARIRGNILMAMSNKFGYLVLTTGNKSEIATGYCTLYGDMAGGFAVIKDVPKTMVFDLAKICPKIPKSIIDRPPSAELRENQKDQDSLPEYAILDAILELYVDKDYSQTEIVEKLNIDIKIVEKVIKLVDFNEYKRRQGAIGIKITNRAFGKERRMPITNRFRS